MAPTTPQFFNLPGASTAISSGLPEERVLGGTRQDHNCQTHWKTFQDQPLCRSSLMDALANNIPLVRHSGFLDAEECNAMLDVLKTHKIVRLLPYRDP